MASFSFTQNLHFQYRKKRILKNKQTSNHFEPQKIIRLKKIFFYIEIHSLQLFNLPMLSQSKLEWERDFIRLFVYC